MPRLLKSRAHIHSEISKALAAVSPAFSQNLAPKTPPTPATSQPASAHVAPAQASVTGQGAVLQQEPSTAWSRQETMVPSNLASAYRKVSSIGSRRRRREGTTAAVEVTAAAWRKARSDWKPFDPSRSLRQQEDEIGNEPSPATPHTPVSTRVTTSCMHGSDPCYPGRVTHVTPACTHTAYIAARIHDACLRDTLLHAHVCLRVRGSLGKWLH